MPKQLIYEEFTNHQIEIQPDDKIFFFSDGLPDQVGGEVNRKYSPMRVRDLIMGNQDFTMLQYAELFSKDFDEYKGNNKQVDDVLLIGIEF